MKSRQRHVGGAHRGLDMWLLQRASAFYMILFLPLFVAAALLAGPLDYASWRGMFQPVAVKVAALLFVAALLAHAWIGLREILIDYVHFLVLRLVLYFAFGALYLGCLIWSVDLLWSVR